MVRSKNDNIKFNPNCSCKESPLLSPSINCNKILVPPPPPTHEVVGVCEKILAKKVVADQIFICRNTIRGLGSNLKPCDVVDDITFTLQKVDCQPIIDTANSKVDINMIFTLDLDVTIIPETDSFTASGVQVTCSGTFCGLTADMFSITDQAMVECDLLRIVDINHSHDKIVNGKLTTTITILSKFILLLKEILVVGLCSHKNTADAVIPAVTCNGRHEWQGIIEELTEIIRKELKLHI